MAKLGDLVVRIGADTRDLNKSLGKVQRNMRSMTSNFTALGQQMTRSITLPILGIGAMAIKSAADLEKMEVSFISLTGGAKQAADMMEQLNEFTASTPFQIDAVATSARQLIASGTKISEVNEQLQFLGDIAATTGQPINEIAAIFSKVNAKGKVELESLNQLAERGIPIFKALSDATGLLPSELGAGRVSVKQFNDTLKSFNQEGWLAEGAMQKLSETASGKFSTALDNLKLAGAALAEDLLPTLNAALDKTIALAKGFTRLSDEVKKNILTVGGLAATIGPLLIVIPKLIAGITATRTAFVSLTAAMATNPFVLAGIALAGLSVLIVQASMDMRTARNETEEFITSLKDLDKQASINAINKQIIADREKLAQANAKLATSQRAANAAGGKFDRQNAQRSTSLYEKQVNDITIGLFRLEEQLYAVKNAAILDETGEDDGLIKVISPKQMKFLEALPVKLIAVQEPIKELKESTSILGDSITTLSDKTIVLAEAFGQAFGEMMGGAKSGGKAFKSFVVDAIRGIIAIAKANIIAAAMSPANPANAVSAGLTAPAFALAGLTALDALLSNIPSLAEGGIAFGPSLVEVGEYSGAGGNPEVIAPLNKLKDMLGGNSIQVYGRISGDDIVISNNRATRDRNRF